MCKTLLFTTSYCNTLQEWDERLYKWLKYFTKSSLYFNKLLILDDSSPVHPEWEDCRVIEDYFTEEPADMSYIFKFKDNLGRPAHLDYPGWFRSFSFAARYAYKFGYEKIIHIESDAYILSNKIINFFNNQAAGWVAFYCNRHQFPETALQIICKDQINNFYYTTQLPYSTYFKNKTIETCLPFTHIERSFKGDRYHEYQDDIPFNADYACQVKHNYTKLHKSSL